MDTSPTRTRSRLVDTPFPLRVGMPPSPPWRRRAHNPGPGTGSVQKGKTRLHLVRRAEEAQQG